MWVSQMKNFYSEVFCSRQGTFVRHTQCRHCPWFAAGTDEAIAIAARAHQCRGMHDERPVPEPAENRSR